MAYYKCGSVYTTQNSNVVVDTASGAIANFKTPLAIPLPKIQFNFKATQEAGTPAPQSPKAISGVSAVKIARTGKNLIEQSKFLISPASFCWGYRNEGFPLKGGITYTFSINQIMGSLRFVSVDEQTIYAQTSGNNKLSYTPTEDVLVVFRLWKAEGVTATEFQLEIGSVDTIYEPYNGNTKVIELGGTYYGGYVTQDKNGKRELVVTHKMLEWSNLNFRRLNNSGNWANYLFFASVSDMKYNYLQKSDIYEIQSVGNVGDIENYKFRTSFSGAVPYVYFRNDDYVDVDAFVMAMNDHQFLYEITEPFTVALPDGEPIITLNGTNNIYADTGDTSLQFRKIG